MVGLSAFRCSVSGSRCSLRNPLSRSRTYPGRDRLVVTSSISRRLRPSRVSVSTAGTSTGRNRLTAATQRRSGKIRL